MCKKTIFEVNDLVRLIDLRNNHQSETKLVSGVHWRRRYAVGTVVASNRNVCEVRFSGDRLVSCCKWRLEKIDMPLADYVFVYGSRIDRETKPPRLCPPEWLRGLKK